MGSRRHRRERQGGISTRHPPSIHPRKTPPQLSSRMMMQWNRDPSGHCRRVLVVFCVGTHDFVDLLEAKKLGESS